MRNGKNTWLFKISSLKTGNHFNTLCFYGVDSEEAHTNCIEWADRHYDEDCVAELVEGEIERNESRRKQQELCELPAANEEVKKKFINVLTIRKIGEMKNV